MEAKNILDFDVWKKSNKSSVKNHQLLALDSELRRARKTVKNCSKALANATEIVQSIYKSFEGYEALYRFPVAVLGRASDVIETCGKVNSDTESCMGVLGSLDVPSGSSLNSEEVSVLKKLRENKLSLRILLLQVQSKTHVQETFMINTIAAHAQRRLDELNKAVERYCGDLSIKDTNSDYSLQSDLCEKLSELEDMHLDWRAGRNQPWSDVQGRKKRMIRTLIVLIDAESGLRSKLDALGARGGGYCVVCETDYELRTSPCGHVCCKACWSDWLEKSETCPMCRRAVGGRELRDLLQHEERSRHQDRVDLNYVSRRIQKLRT